MEKHPTKTEIFNVSQENITHNDIRKTCQLNKTNNDISEIHNNI
jgi:hypothetical protein